MAMETKKMTVVEFIKNYIRKECSGGCKFLKILTALQVAFYEKVIDEIEAEVLKDEELNYILMKAIEGIPELDILYYDWVMSDIPDSDSAPPRREKMFVYTRRQNQATKGKIGEEKMFAFPSMLLPAAKEAGMKVPENADDFDKKEFPRFDVFCILQLGAFMPYPSVVWDNARVIADIKDEEMSTITTKDLIDRGLALGRRGL